MTVFICHFLLKSENTGFQYNEFILAQNQTHTDMRIITILVILFLVFQIIILISTFFTKHNNKRMLLLFWILLIVFSFALLYLAGAGLIFSIFFTTLMFYLGRKNLKKSQISLDEIEKKTYH